MINVEQPSGNCNNWLKEESSEDKFNARFHKVLKMQRSDASNLTCHVIWIMQYIISRLRDYQVSKYFKENFIEMSPNVRVDVILYYQRLTC